MRRFTVILFSFILLYAEAAQALGQCPGDNLHHDHPIGHDHSDSHASMNHDRSTDPAWPVIHCPPEERVGPAIQVASVKLDHLDKVTLVHASFLPQAAAAALRNGLWLEALFKRTLMFSLPNDLARHLLLSVLQI